VLQSQVQTTAVPFWRLHRTHAPVELGEGGVAIADNAWATFWNPAGYAFQQGSEIAMSHADWLPSLGLSDLWIAHLAYKQPVEELDGVVFRHGYYLNLGDFAQTIDNPDVIKTFKGYKMALRSVTPQNSLLISVSASIRASFTADSLPSEQGRKREAERQRGQFRYRLPL